MAAAFFNTLADKEKVFAVSGGTNPGEHIHPEVKNAMQEIGIDFSEVKPQRLTPDIAEGSVLLVTMGCEETCLVVPGAMVEDWALDDPKGKPIEEVRKIREEIKERVQNLVATHGWS
jgi:arsenate reductase